MGITARAACIAVLLLASTAPSPAAVLDVPVTPLIIRIYDGPAITAGHSVPAVKEADDILAAAGFAPEWLSCARPVTPLTRCGVPLAGSELAVRVVVAPRQPQAPRTLAMGYSLIDPRTGGGSLATIYLDRVTQLADATRADLPALLGRAIAHEIGHLLLGTADHGARGVMRAVWSHDVVRRTRPHEWRFTGPESRRMRAAAARRGAASQLAGGRF